MVAAPTSCCSQYLGLMAVPASPAAWNCSTSSRPVSVSTSTSTALAEANQYSVHFSDRPVSGSVGVTTGWHRPSPTMVVPRLPNLAMNASVTVMPRSSAPRTNTRPSTDSRSAGSISSFPATASNSSALTLAAAIRTALPMW